MLIVWRMGSCERKVFSITSGSSRLAGDAGCALGAALHTWHHLLRNPRSCDGVRDRQNHSLLGLGYSNEICIVISCKTNTCIPPCPTKSCLYVSPGLSNSKT